ncbi:unnamed protein product [Cylindrotheca closterium]|uniref:N-acetyltransferase domain-containing protein n=1 Tax=Cylindrotheca closterium TaxID=2856 RepID=A0AAD2G700_9STRA|nr:unnamed protein product [Cylindrotheca closterium]
MCINAVKLATVSFMLALLGQNDAWMLCKNQGKTRERMRMSLYFATTKPDVHVHPVKPQSNQDIMDLADMRYSEWIQGEETGEKTPSLGAFRMATAEIVQERAQEGAMTFLARVESNTKSQPKAQAAAVVGSAELSPIELKGLLPVSHLATTRKWLYVTDVVTSATHRRLGVGTKLMDAVERAAALQFNATRIYLHVRSENSGAMEFYFKRGYQKTSMCYSKEVDEDKLAEAAGAREQILLQKELVAGDYDDEQMQKRNNIKKRSARGGNKGFAKKND